MCNDQILPVLQMGPLNECEHLEGLWRGNWLFNSQFSHHFCISSYHKTPMHQFFCFSNNSRTWNIHFLRSLNKRETDELLTMLSLSKPFQSSQQPNCWVWSLESSGTYTYKSFFDHIPKNPYCYHSIFTKAFCQVKIPLKSEEFRMGSNY